MPVSEVTPTPHPHPHPPGIFFYWPIQSGSSLAILLSASLASFMAFVCSSLSFLSVGRAVLRDCGISYVSSFIFFHIYFLTYYARCPHFRKKLNFRPYIPYRTPIK